MNNPRVVIASYAASTLLAVGVVLLLRQFTRINHSTVALCLVLLVQLIATRWRLVHSIYMSIVCALLYNLFFLPPIGKITIASPQNWVSLVVFLSTSVLVSQLSERERRQKEIAEKRQSEVEQLYEFSQRLMLQEDFQNLARSIPSLVASVFGLRATALYVSSQDKAYYSDPGNELMTLEVMREMSCHAETGIRSIGGIYVFPLMLGLRCFGLFVAIDKGDSKPIYEAIGGLIAISLERVSALERTSHMEAVREGEKLRTALLDSTTHELRTPLTAIRAAATVLASQPDLAEAERREMYAVMDEESMRLDRLIGEAVDTAQLDSSGLQVRLQKEEIREVVESVLDDLRGRLAERQVRLQIAEELPLISMDRELVRRVLRHLIENAIQYSPAKSPVDIGAEIADERFLMHVGNQGEGIERTDQPFVFDKFFRGAGQRNHIEGSGMGLAIVKAILLAHKGGIEVKSEPGHGAVFTFWLTMYPASA